MKKSKGPQAPRHLRPATKRWWRQVMMTWTLEEHHVRLLTLACEAFDRAVEAREIIDAEGITIEDRFGQVKPHPAVVVERDSRIGFARLLRELDLDTEAPPDDARPPTLRRNR